MFFRKKVLISSFFVFAYGLGFYAQAGVESTSTLPVGISSPEISFGIINGLSEKYDSSGNVIGVTDQYHLNLTGANLSKLDKDAAELIRTLNNFSATEKLGDAVSVGTIDFKAKPTIDYIVINPAFGVRKNLAVGFGFPMIHFKNEMQIVSTGVSNVQSIQAYAGTADPKVNDALNRVSALGANLPLTVQDVLAKKGYKPIQNQEYTALGDTQVYARYRYFENQIMRMAVRPYFLLPTGRGDDPDDLTDNAVGGIMGFGTYLTEDFMLFPRYTVTLVCQYEAHFADRVEKRVPVDENDFLPGLDRKESVNRQPGNLFDITLANRLRILKWLGVGGFYDFATKDPDWFSGNREGYNYGLLSRDTGYQTHKLGGFIEFSTTEQYFEKKFAVPFIFGYTFSSVVAAVNAPNTTTHIINLRMFF